MVARRRTRSLARTITLGDALRPSLDRFGVTGDRSAGTAVGRVIAALAKEALPGAADIATNVTVLPNPGPAWARRVGGRSLWIYYRFDDSSVEILGVNVHLPIPRSDE